MQNKSRHISILNFLTILQEEYMSAYLRYKLYPKSSDKSYWEKIMNYKKEKIKDLSEKKKLPNMFTDAQIKLHMDEKFYGKGGLPKLVYKDETDKKNLRMKDIRSYYAVGADVRYVCEEKTIVGVIEKIDFSDEIVKINSIDGITYTCNDFEQVTRIF